MQNLKFCLTFIFLMATFYPLLGCQNFLQGLSQPQPLNPEPSQKPSLILPEGVSLSPNTVRLYKEDFHILETRYFKIFFAETDLQKALGISEASDGAYEELAAWFKQDLVVPYEIYLMPNKSSFRRATGSFYNAAGAVTDRKGTLYLFTDYADVPTMVHEMSHVFLSKKVRDRKVPIWFNEGLAEYLSTPQLKSSSFRSPIHTRVKNLKKIYSIQELERDGMMRDAEATYLQALSLVIFMSEKYGPDKLNQMLDLYGQPDFHQSFEAAMGRVYGKSRSDLEGEWLEFIAKSEHLR